MSCILAVICTSGIFIDGGIVSSNVHERYFTVDNATKYGKTYQIVSQHDNHKNPYGRIAIGFSAELTSKLSASLEYSHQSSLATNMDRGFENLEFRVTFRPFK